MPRRCLRAALPLIAWLIASTAAAQATRAAQIADEKAAKAADTRPEARERGDLIVTTLEDLFMPAPPAIRITSGDFRPGAGLADGVGYVMPVGERGVWSTSAGWSIKNFKQIGPTYVRPAVPAVASFGEAPPAGWKDAQPAPGTRR